MGQQVDNETILEATREILSRSEFRSHNSSQLWSWKEALIRWIVEHLPAGSESLSVWIAYAAITLAVLALGATLFYGLRCLWQLIGQPEDPAPSVQRSKQQTPSQDLDLRPLKEALADGKAREVLWHLHRLWLQRLDQQEQLQFRNWKSNQDYLSECPQGPRNTLDQLSSLYAGVIYGGKDVQIEALSSYIHAISYDGREV